MTQYAPSCTAARIVLTHPGYGSFILREYPKLYTEVAVSDTLLYRKLAMQDGTLTVLESNSEKL